MGLQSVIVILVSIKRSKPVHFVGTYFPHFLAYCHDFRIFDLLKLLQHARDNVWDLKMMLCCLARARGQPAKGMYFYNLSSIIAHCSGMTSSAPKGHTTEDGEGDKRYPECHQRS